MTCSGSVEPQPLFSSSGLVPRSVQYWQLAASQRRPVPPGGAAPGGGVGAAAACPALLPRGPPGPASHRGRGVWDGVRYRRAHPPTIPPCARPAPRGPGHESPSRPQRAQQRRQRLANTNSTYPISNFSLDSKDLRASGARLACRASGAARPAAVLAACGVLRMLRSAGLCGGMQGLGGSHPRPCWPPWVRCACFAQPGVRWACDARRLAMLGGGVSQTWQHHMATSNRQWLTHQTLADG